MLGNVSLKALIIAYHAVPGAVYSAEDLKTIGADGPPENYLDTALARILASAELDGDDADSLDPDAMSSASEPLYIDEFDGDVYVKDVTAGGNAAGMSGQVQKGDVIQKCSATFGGQMWSTRGAGLDRVTRAIEVRAGPTVTLVLQSKAEQRNFLADIFAGQSAAQERRVEEADKKARALEDEVKAERKEAAKGFFGLF